MTKKALRKIRREIEHALLYAVFGLGPRDELAEDDIESAARRLPENEDDLERIQVELRYAFNFAGSLSEVLGDDTISDRAIRHLLLALDVEITSRLTGEPRKRLPFAVAGFRGVQLPPVTSARESSS